MVVELCKHSSGWAAQLCFEGSDLVEGRQVFDQLCKQHLSSVRWYERESLQSSDVVLVSMDGLRTSVVKGLIQSKEERD